MPTPLFDQNPQTPTEPEAPTRSRWQRVTDSTRTTGSWLRAWAEKAVTWARQQPPRHLAIGAGALLVLLALVAWWLSPDQAQPQTGEGPPPWLVAIQHVSLWEQLYGAASDYAQQHATAAGMPSWLLLTLWAGIGASLLITSWCSARSRFVVTTLAFWGWLAATSWVIWTHTPGASPVPAVLTAALGVTLSAAPWSVLPITALVLLGVAA